MKSVYGGPKPSEMGRLIEAASRGKALKRVKDSTSRKGKCAVCGGNHNAFSKHSDKEARTAGI